MEEVFVTYSNETDDFNTQVYSFVDLLRINGFNAFCDESEKQKMSSANFSEIMTRGLQADKVIVVLSRGYKIKAENDKGGVGTEYKAICNELQQNKDKYIFVSFERLTDDVIDDITPILFKSYHIIDLTKDEDNHYVELFSKIRSERYRQFAEVSDKKVAIKSIQNPRFSLKKKDAKGME